MIKHHSNCISMVYLRNSLLRCSIKKLISYMIQRKFYFEYTNGKWNEKIKIKSLSIVTFLIFFSTYFYMKILLSQNDFMVLVFAFLNDATDWDNYLFWKRDFHDLLNFYGQYVLNVKGQTRWIRKILYGNYTSLLYYFCWT